LVVTPANYNTHFTVRVGDEVDIAPTGGFGYDLYQEAGGAPVCSDGEGDGASGAQQPGTYLIYFSKSAGKSPPSTVKVTVISAESWIPIQLAAAATAVLTLVSLPLTRPVVRGIRRRFSRSSASFR
jgi:hypothetical protein